MPTPAEKRIAYLQGVVAGYTRIANDPAWEQPFREYAAARALEIQEQLLLFALTVLYASVEPDGTHPA